MTSRQPRARRPIRLLSLLLRSRFRIPQSPGFQWRRTRRTRSTQSGRNSEPRQNECLKCKPCCHDREEHPQIRHFFLPCVSIRHGGQPFQSHDSLLSDGREFGKSRLAARTRGGTLWRNSPKSAACRHSIISGYSDKSTRKVSGARLEGVGRGVSAPGSRGTHRCHALWGRCRAGISRPSTGQCPRFPAV